MLKSAFEMLKGVKLSKKIEIILNTIHKCIKQFSIILFKCYL
jgi:hypothetical protein